METKICSKCKEEKDICEFNKNSSNKTGYRSNCRRCDKLFKSNSSEYYKEWNKNNPDKVKNKIEKWNSKNRDYFVVKYNSDLFYKLKVNMRNRLNTFVKLNNFNKKNKTFDIVGCSPEFLKEYLEQKFTEGMSWELMGQHIHIDHIIPLSSANTEEEVYKLCHYTNLQPLWAEDNLKKGSKIL